MEIGQAMTRAILFALSIASLGALSDADAQSYPTKPVTVIVSNPPGGSVDPIFRVIQPLLEKSLGQPVVIENRGGAAGNIGSAIVARAPADGYTLLLTNSAVLTTNPFLFKSMNFDVNKDLTPVTTVAQGAVVIVVHKSLPVRNILELIEFAKREPNGITYGTAGFGSPFHIAGEYFKQRAGIKMEHVPFNGGGPMAQAVAGGHIQAAVTTLATIGALVRNDSVRLIGVMDSKRLPSHPDIQTVAETLPGIEAPVWSAVMAPANTPDFILSRLNEEMSRALHDPANEERIQSLFNQTVMGESREVADARIRSEQKKWSEVIRSMGLVAQ